ncbi:MAG: fluoride efflux transporter CrcB [Pseudomonadota bacterium]
MNLALIAAAGGALGAAARYLVSVAAVRMAGPGAVFPWGTLTVNIVGSFLMGVVVHWLAVRAGGGSELRTFLATGILGGFTTFSAFSLDVVSLIERKETALAALYVFGSVGLSIGALFLGLLVARQIIA